MRQRRAFFIQHPGGEGELREMAENEPTQAVTNDAAPAVAANQQPVNAPAQDAENVDSLPGWAQKMLKDLRSENATHRKAKTAAEQAAAQAAEQAAKEQGQWKELAEKYEPQARRAHELEAFVSAQLDSRINAVPDRYRALIPAFDDPLKKLEWLEQATASGLLQPPQTPQTDAAVGSGQGGQQKAKTPVNEWDRLPRAEKAARLGVKIEHLPQD